MKTEVSLLNSPFPRPPMYKYARLLEFSHSDFLSIQLKIRSWLSSPDTHAEKSPYLQYWKDKGYDPLSYYVTVNTRANGLFSCSLRVKLVPHV